jgi:acyl carrier protein
MGDQSQRVAEILVVKDGCQMKTAAMSIDLNPGNLTLETRHFIMENFLFDEGVGSLDDEASFLENGVLDSTGVLQLVAFLEQRFEIQVADDELLPENLDSVRNVVDYLLRKLL